MNLTVGTCTPIHAGHILAADVARAVREFAAVPGDEIIGYAPVPGSRRVLHSGDLRRLASKFNVKLDSEPQLDKNGNELPVTRAYSPDVGKIVSASP